MTDAKDSFQEVKKWFNLMVELDELARAKIWQQIEQEGRLSESDLALLEQMLSADAEPTTATQSIDLSQRVFKEAVSDLDSDEEKHFGAYKLNKLIGSGGMGQVFLAERADGQFTQKVALKISHAYISVDLKKRFENERQILSDLSHTNIARLLDGGTSEQGKPFIVMEYIEGENIAEYCVNKQPSLEQRIKLVLQICSAITHAHQKLVLHRDLKPENILVTDQGEVKLLDFGIAKLMSEDSQGVNKTATQIMTRYYASPEQIKGQAVSTQSDLFSLAVIAFELITGCHPFYKNSDTENNHQREQNVLSGQVMRIHQRGEIEKPLFPELSNIPIAKIKGDLEHILLKALVAEPTERYSSVSAFSDDLKLFLSNKPISAQKPSKLYTLKKLMQRQKVASAAVIFTVITLVFATGFSIWKAEVAEYEKNKALMVSEMMQDMFEKARPAAGSDEVMAKDLLHQAITHLKSNNELDAESRFQLMNVIFESYSLIGKSVELRTAIEGIYDRCVKALGQYNHECQRILIYMSHVEHMEGKDELAASIFQKVEDIERANNQRDKTFLVEILRRQYASLINSNQADKAKEKSLEALELMQDLPNTEAIDMVNLLHRLSVSDISEKNYDKAEDKMNQMEALLMGNYSDEADTIAGFYNFKGFYFSSRKQQTQAVIYRKKAIKLIDEAYTVKPLMYGLYSMNLAKSLARSGETEAALKQFQKTNDFYIDNGYGRKYRLIDNYINMILIALILDKQEQANGYMESIIQIGLEHMTKDHFAQCNYKLSLAYLSIFNNSYEEALNSINALDNCKILADGVKPSKYFTSYIHILMARLEIQNKKYHAASEHLNQAEPFLLTRPDDYHTLKQHIISLKQQIKQHETR